MLNRVTKGEEGRRRDVLTQLVKEEFEEVKESENFSVRSEQRMLRK